MSDYKAAVFEYLPPLCIDYYFTRLMSAFVYDETLFYGVPVNDISINVY